MPIERMLHIANTRPAMRTEFYALKKRILEARGQRDGYDLQHFDGKICFACDGAGEWYHPSGDYGDVCERCWGTGYWRLPRVVILDRYRFGKYRFHVPRDEPIYHKATIQNLIDSEGAANNQIKGFVEHRYIDGSAPELSMVWLFLIYGQWKAIWKWLTSSRRHGWQWHPFFILQWIACTTRWWWLERQRKKQANQGDVPF